MRFAPRYGIALTVAALSIGVAACGSDNGSDGGGGSSAKSGSNTATPRETVESYLLLRAAEVTRAAGFTNFVFDTRNTRANTSYQTVPYGPPDPFWGRPRGFGYWGGWGFPYEPSYDVVVRTNYEAYAEVVLLTPEQAAHESRAINAAEVISRIGPEAAPPPPRPNQT